MEEYIKWARENHGMTDDQVKEFKTLTHDLGYDDLFGTPDFAADLLKSQTPPAEIIDLMKKGLAKRQLQLEIQN